jgi:hypothetical protein
MEIDTLCQIRFPSAKEIEIGIKSRLKLTRPILYISIDHVLKN